MQGRAPQRLRMAETINARCRPVDAGGRGGLDAPSRLIVAAVPRRTPALPPPMARRPMPRGVICKIAVSGFVLSSYLVAYYFG